MSVSWPRAWRRLAAVPAGSRRPARKPLMASCACRAAGVPSRRGGLAASSGPPQPAGPPQWPAWDGRGRLAGGRPQCGQRLARSWPWRRQKKVTGSDQAAGIWPGSSARQAGQNRVAALRRPGQDQRPRRRRPGGEHGGDRRRGQAGGRADGGQLRGGRPGDAGRLVVLAGRACRALRRGGPGSWPGGRRRRAATGSNGSPSSGVSVNGSRPVMPRPPGRRARRPGRAARQSLPGRRPGAGRGRPRRPGRSAPRPAGRRSATRPRS